MTGRCAHMLQGAEACPAIDEQRLARDEAGSIAHKEGHRGADFAGLRKSVHGYSRCGSKAGRAARARERRPKPKNEMF